MLNIDKLVLQPCQEHWGEVNRGYPAPQFSPKSGPQFSASGIFYEAYKENVIKDGEIITVTMPILGVRVAEMIVMPKQDDRVIIRGKTYAIREVRPDGEGALKLMLNDEECYESP